MTLTEYIDNKKLAINTHFVLRNKQAVGPAYLSQARAQRRRIVRRCIRELRMATSRETAFMVKAVIADLPSPQTKLH